MYEVQRRRETVSGRADLKVLVLQRARPLLGQANYDGPVAVLKSRLQLQVDAVSQSRAWAAHGMSRRPLSFGMELALGPPTF